MTLAEKLDEIAVDCEEEIASQDSGLEFFTRRDKSASPQWQVCVHTDTEVVRPEVVAGFHTDAEAAVDCAQRAEARRVATIRAALAEAVEACAVECEAIARDRAESHRDTIAACFEEGDTSTVDLGAVGARRDEALNIVAKIASLRSSLSREKA